MNKEKIISEFNLKPFGGKGWMRGDLQCPECQRGDKFGIMFTDSGAVCNCFHDSVKLPLWKVLKSIGRTDLLDHDFDYTPTGTLSSLERDFIPEEVQTIKLPVGFIRIDSDPYLEGRGFTKEQYSQFRVGVAELDPKTKNKLIFLIYQKGELAGWLARSRESKEWHKENIRQHKQNGTPVVLRYRNSNNDFSKLLGALDEITPNTHTLILVEGIMDKANVDRLLKLNDSDEIKCCFTFGGDLSIEQVNLIPKTVENVILMYDEGTIKNMKEAGGRLMSRFDVKVALIKDKTTDPGSATSNFLLGLLSNLQNFLYFYTNLNSLNI